MRIKKKTKSPNTHVSWLLKTKIRNKNIYHAVFKWQRTEATNTINNQGYVPVAFVHHSNSRTAQEDHADFGI